MYRTTLQDQLFDDAQARIARYRSTVETWLSDAEFTHAVTLTLIPGAVRSFASQLEVGCDSKDSRMMDAYSAALKRFGNRLNSRLFGNAARRNGKSVLLVPVFEGLRPGKTLHVHTGLGVPVDRFDTVSRAVDDAWHDATDFAGRTDVRLVTNTKGWSRYLAKEAVFFDRPSIDWMSVRLPKS